MALELPAAPRGEETLNVNFDGTTLETFTYRPAGEIKGVLLNFHGSGRNAEGSRDAAIKVADAHGLYVVAPKFEKGEFPNDLYQRGGMLSGRDALLPESEWTISLVDDIAEWAHAKVGNDPNHETIATGHSAGGQFLSRVAAFGPDVFDKIIVTNPSTHVRASLTEDLPFGFGDLPDAEAALKNYLAAPVTIYAGSRDNDPNAADLATSSAAMRQGDNRLERAQFVYEEAKEVAESNGWDFNWEMVVADGVAHDSRGMLHAPEFRQAFDGRVEGSSAPVTDSTSTKPPVEAPVEAPDQSPVEAPAETPVQPPVDGPAPTPAGQVFDFDRVSEWRGAVIKDFEKGDVFDFRDIDANSDQRGDQAFEFLGLVGSRAFTSDGAEIRVRHHQGDTYLYLNTDDDRNYEAKGKIEGIHHLTADDFLL